MVYPFQRTLRSLNGYESGTRGALVAVGAIALGGLVIWATCAEIPVLEVSARGRLEPHNAVHRIEPPASGRVVRSLLDLDKQVSAGDLLVEFDAEEERLAMQQSQATATSLRQALAAIEAQIDNKREELEATRLADEAALREALAKEQELAPRLRLAARRDELARSSPAGATSELEKMERHAEKEVLEHSSRIQNLALVRLQREHAVRREALTAEVLELERERLEMEGRLAELEVSIARSKYQIEQKLVRAPAAGRLVDVVELASGAYILQGTRIATVLATETAHIRVRTRFPKETVGVVRPGQRARLELDGYPWTIYGTVPAVVSSVGTEPGINPTPEAIPGSVRVELELSSAADPRIPLQHGLTGTAEVEVARVSPLRLLLRAIGEWEPAPNTPPDNPANGPRVAEAEPR